MCVCVLYYICVTLIPFKCWLLFSLKTLNRNIFSRLNTFDSKFDVLTAINDVFYLLRWDITEFDDVFRGVGDSLPNLPLFFPKEGNIKFQTLSNAHVCIIYKRKLKTRGAAICFFSQAVQMRAAGFFESSITVYKLTWGHKLIFWVSMLHFINNELADKGK
jgi:hypothetical protein